MSICNSQLPSDESIGQENHPKVLTNWTGVCGVHRQMLWLNKGERANSPELPSGSHVCIRTPYTPIQ